MERELVDLFEAAKKAADLAASGDVSFNGPEVSRCVDALKQVKAFLVTYDILVSTQVGKRLRPLTKHPGRRSILWLLTCLTYGKKLLLKRLPRVRKMALLVRSRLRKIRGQVL